MENSNHDLQITQNMRRRTCFLDREGDYWTDDDREQLRTMFFDGIGITKIAILLQRTEPAVIQQIEKLNLYCRRKYKSKKNISASDQCACPLCKVSASQCPRSSMTAMHEQEAFHA